MNITNSLKKNYVRAVNKLNVWNLGKTAKCCGRGDLNHSYLSKTHSLMTNNVSLVLFSQLLCLETFTNHCIKLQVK